MEGEPSFGRRHSQPSHAKRRHSQMEAGHRRSPSPLFVRQDASSSPPSSYHGDGDANSAQPARNTPRLLLPPRPARSRGDGYDYRRPISSMNQTYNNPVIDLTDDDEGMTSAYTTPQPEQTAPPPPPRTQRLPRFSRQIIDLSADPSPPEPRHAHLPSSHAPRQHHAQQDGAIAVPSSPEVQFVSARPRSPWPPTPHERNRPPPRDAVLDLTNENDDDVVHVRTEGRPGINMVEPRGPHAHNLAALGTLANLFGNGAIRHGRFADVAAQYGFPRVGRFSPWGDDDDGDAPAPPLARGGARLAAMLPMALDYETVQFGVADVDPDDEPLRMPTPKYSPPPRTAPGFTRDPQEDEELICPNCLEELGVGKTDVKKQVWVVKACGHVYCGECMVNRKKPKGKGKARVTDPVLPSPFNSCKAPGCDKSLNKNQVMQIFL